ncbi:MAG: sugar ABC transporter permease [Actinobacteria bacterium]|nr:sugar ABC transporter permease [Actinomycetota bacterium]
MKKTFFKNYSPFLYILPSLVFLAFIFIYPVIQNFQRSFFRFAGGKSIFLGFDNYKYLFLKDTITHKAVLHNFQLLMVIPILLVLAIFFAVLISERIRFAKVYQTLLFIPFIISIVVVGVVFSRLLRLDGIINFILNNIGLGILAKDWLGRPQYAIYAVMFVIIWKELPFGIILFLAGINNINKDIIEAAKIDGANWFQTLIHVTIPQLKNIINFYVVYNVMVVFAWVFTYVFVLTNGGPANSTTILELQIYNLAFKKNLMGMASALSILLFLLIFVFIYLRFRLQRGALEEE